jgi:hypothetical protein
MAAVATHVDVAAESSGAAAQDGPERLQLLVAEAGVVSFQKPVALRTEDISHLQYRTVHG